ncbi:uncharacterized protein METZ01_LOCUS503138, partial [marine metagenome]
MTHSNDAASSIPFEGGEGGCGVKGVDKRPNFVLSPPLLNRLVTVAVVTTTAAHPEQLQMDVALHPY